MTLEAGACNSHVAVRCSPVKGHSKPKKSICCTYIHEDISICVYMCVYMCIYLCAHACICICVLHGLKETFWLVFAFTTLQLATLSYSLGKMALIDAGTLGGMEVDPPQAPTVVMCEHMPLAQDVSVAIVPPQTPLVALPEELEVPEDYVEEMALAIPASPSSEMFTTGSTCSGLDIEVFAMKDIQARSRHKFSCDVLPEARAFACANHLPEQMFQDLMVECFQMPYCDAFFSGFPCQPFSRAGNRLGEYDPRGRIIDGIVQYLRLRLPKCFLLENSKGLTDAPHQRFLQGVLATLRGIMNPDTDEPAYEVHCTVLNTKHYGLPQNRPRAYIAGC